MKKFLLMGVLIFACTLSSQAQNIIIQQNNQQQQTEKVIVKEVEKPVFIKMEETTQGPICIHGYLYVYPEDLGKFNWYPRDIINSINEAKAYGRNNWRLPTWNELQVMNANKSKLGGWIYKLDGWERYMFVDRDGWVCHKHYNTHKRLDGEYEYYVRLVSTN